MLWKGKKQERDLLGAAECCWMVKPLGGMGFSGLYSHSLVQNLYHSKICQAVQKLQGRWGEKITTKNHKLWRDNNK